jgi:hypothetical protein
MIIGAAGQDGYFLTERLLDEQWKVLAGLLESEKGQKLLEIHAVELSAPQPLFDLIAHERPGGNLQPMRTTE